MRGPGREVRHGPHHSHDERDSHGGLQALSAHIPKHDKRRAVMVWDDLEEISANLSGGFVDAFDLESFNCRKLVGNQDLLHGARGLELAGKAQLLSPILN